MSKLLILDIKDAQTFEDWKWSKDRVFVSKGVHVKKSDIASNFLNVPSDTIHARHLANALHVLMGEKPVSRYRRCSWAMDGKILEAARNSKVRITGRIKETKMTRKPMRNANSKAMMRIFLDGKWMKVPGGELYFDRLKRIVGDEIYNKILTLACQLNNGILPSMAKECIQVLNQNNTKQEVRDLVEHMIKEKKASVATLFGEGMTRTNTSYGDNKSDNGKFTSLTTNFAKESIVRFSATVYVPIDGEAVSRLNNGSGFARFLEGGLVTVVGLAENSETLLYETVNTMTEEIPYVPN